MVAIGEGTRAEVLHKVESMGTNLLTISAGQLEFVAGRQQRAGAVAITLTEKDAAAIPEEIGVVAAVAPAQSRRLPVKYQDQTTTTAIAGTTTDYQTVRNFHPVSGEFFDEEQEKASARVAVLGQTARLNLFGNGDPIGETIRISNVPFQVIGLLEPKGLDISGQDQDDQIVIPLRTALRRVFNLTYLSTIYASVDDRGGMDRAAAAVADLLRERHRLRPGAADDFTIQSQTSLLASQSAVSSTFTALLGSIGSVSLLVGGVGILAIMLISVRERSREIGIRRALGARRKDILLQFLIETSLLSVIGGLLGVLVGIAGGKVVSLTTGWPMLIPWSAAVVAVAFSVALGLIFGVYPARKAAALDPIAALRRS
jgi:putative ABC transport system permease protein